MKRFTLLLAISLVLISGLVSATYYSYPRMTSNSYSYERGWMTSNSMTDNSRYTYRRSFTSTVGSSPSYYRRSFQPTVGSANYPYRNSFAPTVGSSSEYYQRPFVSTVGPTSDPYRRTFSSGMVTTNYPYGSRFKPVVSRVTVASSGSRQDPLIRVRQTRSEPTRDQRYYATYYS